MLIRFSKYQGAGNDFIIINTFDSEIELQQKQIEFLCDRHFGIGADGLMTIHKDKELDFFMRYYNADGDEGSMCGNGGRCIAKFAFLNNISGSEVKFRAIDGQHTAKVFDKEVFLSMNDVNKISSFDDGYFLDTGSPHFVTFRKNLSSINTKLEGEKIANELRFKPNRTNVNFIEIKESENLISTFERGVEDETLACGTGAIASALSLHYSNKIKSNKIKISAKGGTLTVSFNFINNSYHNIVLSGPAEFVFLGEIEI